MINQLRKLLLLIFTLLILGSPIHSLAQLVLSDQDAYNMLGTIMQVELDTSSIAVNVGSEGANQTWDFTSLSLNGYNFPVEYMTPAGTPFEDNFPGANFVQKSEISEGGFDGHIYAYHTIDSDNFDHLGNGIQVGGFTYLQESGAEDVPLPLNYEDQWSISSAETLEANIVTSYVTKIQSDYTIDGWGTLKLPVGDFQVLRMKQNYSDTTETYVNGFLVYTETTSSISYTWTGKEALVLLRISSSDGETDPNFNAASEVWRVSDITTSTVEDLTNEAVPLKFKLHQNFPNPFNPETIISYSLPQKSDVTVSIYDITGRLIDNISPGLQSAGTHEVRWQAANHLASGAYMYRIQAVDFVSTKKMILLR